MLIAQAPGKQENQEGKMFVGPSGEILDNFLEQADIQRSKIYMTNLIKCMLPDYREPKQNEIDTCSQYLNQEIELIAPEILVPLGKYAAQYIFAKYGLSFDGRFADLTGKLHLTKDYKKIYPLAHPASFLYDISFKEQMKENYQKLGGLQQPCRWHQVCPMKHHYEAGKLDRKWIELYCKGNWENCVRFQKEEKGEYHSDYMLPNGKIKEDLKNNQFGGTSRI